MHLSYPFFSEINFGTQPNEEHYLSACASPRPSVALHDANTTIFNSFTRYDTNQQTGNSAAEAKKRCKLSLLFYFSENLEERSKHL